MSPLQQVYSLFEILSLFVSYMFLFFAIEDCIFRQYSGEGDDNWVTEATFTQELDLQKQLQWGSRYLDIRVGYCKFLYNGPDSIR